MEEPLLLPRPRRLEQIGAEGAPSDAPPLTKHAPQLGAQSFTLDTSGKAPLLCHGDGDARRYGMELLRQLRRGAGARLPALHIEDSPDFPIRGYLLDISRDRVPSRAFLELLVERLAVLRINHLQLYVEHSYAYPGHEVVWQNASPLDAEDLQHLDALCRAHGIELAANQNCFGHTGRWLKHDAYRVRAETPEGFVTASGRRLPPATLAPSEDNARFALGLCREQLSRLTSRRINIGFDEPFELGRGASAEQVRRLGRERVYLEHLQRMLRALHEQGCEVLFWGDVLRGHPQLVRELPRQNTVALAWHYEAPMREAEFPAALRERFAELGVSLGAAALAGFAGHVTAYAECGVPFWVCPGTSTWNSFVGRLPNARANLLDAAEAGVAHGAGGYLVTDWGDNGHMQPPVVSLPPLAYGAALAWCAERNRELPLAAALDAHIFEDRAGVLGAALDEMGGLYAETGLGGYNGSPLFHALLGGALGRFGEADAGRSLATAETLERLSARLFDARPACSDGDTIVRELRCAARLAHCGALRIAEEAGAAGTGPGRAESAGTKTGTGGGLSDALKKALRDIIPEQRACWLLRSRPGGLEDSIARLQGVVDAIEG